MVLLGGCLTLGVLGAAKCLLNGERGQRDTAYRDGLAPGGDLIAVTATRKIGGITDTPDLTAIEPLLLLTRDTAGGFTTRLDNPEHAPAEVVEYVADQLGHSPSVLAGYGAERTRWDHQNAIKEAYGYRDLKGDAWWKLTRWLPTWPGSPRSATTTSA